MPSSALFITGDADIRALIVVCRYLGDVLLATPLARSLTHAGYTVDWLVAAGTEALLEAQPFAHRVYVISATTPWSTQLGIGRQLWRQHDVAFVLTASDRPMVLALAASRKLYAMIPAEGRKYAWKRCVSSQWIPYEGKQHMVWRAMQLGQLANVQTHADVGIEWSDGDTKIIQGALPWGPHTAYIHLHPFARWPYKWWNRECWRELLGHILDAGLHVAITGSPQENEEARKLVEGYAEDKVCILAGKLNWRQLACLSRHAAAYVGLDTGNTHLAASTGTLVIALFGPTDPRIWGPWPDHFDGETPWQARTKNGIQRCLNVSLLQGTQNCIPCQLEGCGQQPDSDSICLQSMKAQWVWKEIQARLGEHIS